MKDPELKSAVLEQLEIGKKKAVQGKPLAQRLGLKDSRPARLAIIELIKDGVPILSDSSHGYWIAESPDEIKEAMKTLQNYGISAIVHRRDLLRCLKKMEVPLPVVGDGQIRLI